MTRCKPFAVCAALLCAALATSCPTCEPEPIPGAVDGVPPDTLLTHVPDPLAASRLASFEFGASELGATFECALDDRAFEACASPSAAANLEAGDHRFRVRAIDAAGNIDPSPAHHAWRVDPIAPDTTIVAGPVSPSASADAVFELSCSESDCRFECALDNGDFAPCNATVAVRSLAAGSHALLARAIDGAGNVDPAAAVWPWTIDLTPPRAPELRLNGGAPRTLSRTIDVELTVAEASALQLSESSEFAGAAWQPVAAHLTWTLADSAGDHLLYARARDEAGNLSTSTAAAIALDRSADALPFVSVPQSDDVETDPAGRGERAIDRAIVALRDWSQAPALAEALRTEQASWLIGALPGQRALLVRVPAATGIDAMLSWLGSRPEVEWAEPDLAGAPALPAGVPGDSGVQSGDQWYLQQIRAPAAWELLDRLGIPFGMPAVRVAVIDSGIDLAHPDLAAHIDVGSALGLPANLVDAASDGAFEPWRAPLDDSGHGTHVAGIIGAIADNELRAPGGIAGIAGSVTLLPIKASRGQRFFAFAIAAALQRATDQAADVINLSFELPDSLLVRRAVKAAAQRSTGPGVLMVHAAGNWGAPPDCELVDDAAAPADLAPYLLSVAAVDRSGQRAAFSRFGGGVDLAAPGGSTAQCGAAAGGDDMLSTTPGAGYTRRYGTSAAAAVVSGVAALLLSIDRAADGVRDLGVAEIEHALSMGAVLVGDANFSATSGGSRNVDAWVSARLVSCLQVAPLHDGGDGSCLPPGVCAAGHHLGGTVHCVPLGICNAGFHVAGDGSCTRTGSGPAADGGVAVEDAGIAVEDGGVADNGTRLVALTLQPGPDDGKDIWTTSTYSYADDGSSAPGGGLDDNHIDLGGWDDRYVGLLQFDLTRLPPAAIAASIELYCSAPRGDANTEIELRRITEFWDWRSQGTGRDRLRLWWGDRPAAEPWGAQPLPAPIVGSWYRIDVTDLYRRWQSGELPNHGVLLWPVRNDNRWARFYSSNQTIDPALRPRLVVVAPAP